MKIYQQFWSSVICIDGRSNFNRLSASLWTRAGNRPSNCYFYFTALVITENREVILVF